MANSGVTASRWLFAKVRVQYGGPEAREGHAIDPRVRLQESSDLRNGDARGFAHRVAVHTATDGRERHRARAVLRRESQRFTIGRCQQLRLAVRSTAPDWADCVDDVSRWQP